MSNNKEKSNFVLDEQIGFVLRLAVQFHTAIFTSLMVEELTQTQFATLARVREVGACTQSELTRLLTLDSATVNGVVDRLYGRGLIDMVADPGDGRRQTISLSKEGLRVCNEAEAAVGDITRKTAEALTQSEHLRVVQLLRKMIGVQNAPKLDLAIGRQPKARKGTAEAQNGNRKERLRLRRDRA